MMIVRPLCSVPVLWLQWVEPANSHDLIAFAEDLKSRGFGSLGLDAAVLLDLSPLTAHPASLRQLQDYAIDRGRLQGAHPAGPLSVICRNRTDLLRARFYGVAAHYAGVRDEAALCATLAPREAVDHIGDALAMSTYQRHDFLREIRPEAARLLAS